MKYAVLAGRQLFSLIFILSSARHFSSQTIATAAAHEWVRTGPGRLPRGPGDQRDEQATAIGRRSRIQAVAGSMIGPSRVWHWYDFACPYSYVAQDRNAGLRRLGLCPDLLPYSVRIETGPSEALSEARNSPTHHFLERAAQAAGLALR
jgi:hypothetical protein